MTGQNSGGVDPGKGRERDGKTEKQGRERSGGSERRENREEEEDSRAREISGMTVKGSEVKEEHRQLGRHLETSGVRLIDGKEEAETEAEAQQGSKKEREATRGSDADENDLDFLSDGEEGTERVFNEWEYVFSVLLGMLSKDVKAFRFLCPKSAKEEKGELPSCEVLGTVTRHYIGEKGSDAEGDEKRREVERVDHSQEAQEETNGSELEKRSLFTSGTPPLLPFSPHEVGGEREEENNRNVNATETEEENEQVFSLQPSGDSISLRVRVHPPVAGTSSHPVGSVCTADVLTKKRGVPWSNGVSAEDSYGALDTKAQHVAPLLSSFSTEKLILNGETYESPRQRVVEPSVASSFSSSSSSSSSLSALQSVVHSENDICRLLSQLLISHSKSHRRSIQRREIHGPDERRCSSNRLLLSPAETKTERRRESRCIWCMLKGSLSPIDIAILQHEILRLRCIRSFKKLPCFS